MIWKIFTKIDDLLQPRKMIFHILAKMMIFLKFDKIKDFSNYGKHFFFKTSVKIDDFSYFGEI